MKRKQDIIDRLDSFTRGYIEAALFSETDESTPEGGEPLDKNFSTRNIANESLLKMILDCEKFQAENEADIGSRTEEAGRDFWFTRNRTGAGFWDGDWPKEAGERLTRNSKAFGEINLYLSRRVIHLFPCHLPTEKKS